MPAVPIDPPLGDHSRRGGCAPQGVYRGAGDERGIPADQADAGTRMIAITVLNESFHDHLLGADRHQLETLRDDPVLGVAAHVLLTEPDHAVQFPPHLQQWVALEAVARTLDNGIFDDPDLPGRSDALTALWQIIDQDADLDSAWTSTHPQLTDVLEAVAAHHLKGRIRKAAKKALFKTRNQRPPSPPARRTPPS
jgi:hypothetical protein